MGCVGSRSSLCVKFHWLTTPPGLNSTALNRILLTNRGPFLPSQSLSKPFLARPSRDWSGQSFITLRWLQKVSRQMILDQCSGCQSDDTRLPCDCALALVCIACAHISSRLPFLMRITTRCKVAPCLAFVLPGHSSVCLGPETMEELTMTQEATWLRNHCMAIPLHHYMWNYVKLHVFCVYDCLGSQSKASALERYQRWVEHCNHLQPKDHSCQRQVINHHTTSAEACRSKVLGFSQHGWWWPHWRQLFPCCDCLREFCTAVRCHFRPTNNFV